MAVNMFLNINNNEIKGEASNPEHRNEIEIFAWDWGMRQSGSFHHGGGGGAGKVSFQDISVTKWIDLASSQLALYCANGDHFDEAVITVRKAGKKPLAYIIIKMTDVLVTSISTGGSGGQGQDAAANLGCGGLVD